MRAFLTVIVAGLLATALALADSPAAPVTQHVVVFGIGKRYTPTDTSTDRPDTEKYSQDIAELVAKYAGFPFRIETFDSTSDLFHALDTGAIDVIPTAAHRPDRDAKYLFSVPHVRGSLVATIRVGEGSVRTVAQFKGRRIGVVADSYEATFVAKQVPEAVEVFYPRTLDAMLALRDGKIDAVVSNEFSSLSTIYRAKLDGTLRVGFTVPDSVIEFCMIVRLGRDSLLAQLNDGLFLAEQNGDLRRNYDKWFYVFDPAEASRSRILRWSLGIGLGLVVLGVFAWLWTRGRIRNEAIRRREIERQVVERTHELETTLRRLRESEEHFARAFKFNPSAVGIVDLETGKFIEVNDQYPQIFGYGREELIGRTAPELGLWVRPDEEAVYRQRLLASGQIRDFEAELLAQDGRKITCSINAEVIELQGRKVTIATTTNLTERRAMEAEKERLKAQLQHAQRLEAVGTLAGGVAHDFNNILTAIVANAELADLTNDLPTIRDHLSEVKQACQRAKDLVRRILALSRREKQERSVVDLGRLLSETVSLLRSSVAANVEIRTFVDPHTPPLLADSSQLHQVLVNLCTNASYAMRPAGGTLTLSAEGFEVSAAQEGELPELKPGRYAKLSIADTGHGMNAETIQHIFEPFYTTKGPGEGTGLGLAVVRGIVQEHQGCVTVSSRMRVGTTVSVYLPAAPEGSQRPVAPADRTAPLGQAESVLLVDDDVMVLTSVKNMIEMALHYKVAAFNHPAKALAAFQRSPGAFNLVLTDLTMPGMTGIELAGEILKLRERIPVVLMTGYSDHWTQETIRELGLTDLLMKPVNLAELAWTLREALEQETGAGFGNG